MLNRVFGFFIFSFLLTFQSYAQQCPSEPLVIATADFPPFVRVNNEQLAGTMMSETIALLDRLNTDYDISIVHWARVIKSAEAGQVEAVIPAMISDERKAFLDYSLPPIGQASISLYQLKENADEINQSDILPSASIVYVRSVKTDFSKLNGAQTYPVKNYQQALKMLEVKRVDYVLAVKEVFDEILMQQEKLDIVEVKVVETQNVYLALSKNHPNYKQRKACLLAAAEK